MLLDRASELFEWPAARQVLRPSGAGPGVVARNAQQKIGNALTRLLGLTVNVGVLYAHPATNSTDAPIAIVCELPSVVGEESLRQVHRLAWNFCRAPLLITLDPVSIKAWSCCIAPLTDIPATPEVLEARTDWESVENDPGTRALNWSMLASDRFFEKYRSMFAGEGRADQLLLENLRFLRKRLLDLGIPKEVIHDLLGRILFIQFLFDRKDSDGKAALNPEVLRRLQGEGVLRGSYAQVAELLRNYDDAYALFRWLNEKFNGDLFPGKSKSASGRDVEWKNEMSLVTQEHLEELADFVSGKMEMQRGQRSLFPFYCFDTIPLDFISSIYEEFVSADGDSVGAHYTPGHLVDFVLDSVLPWNEEQWDVRVLDPSCGSGIFLVKVYQRLIHRWKRAQQSEEVPPAVLRNLLESNLFGIDKNPLAVRVASFSLYLAMCDEIDPRRYWTQVKFPRLRGVTLHTADTFESLKPQYEKFSSRIDLVVGNAPWGRNSVSADAQRWALEHGWPVPYKSIGPLFLPKAIEFGAPNATIAMLQPLGLIMNRVSSAVEFRRKLFISFEVSRVINLAALRFGLFKQAVAPACVIVMRARQLKDYSVKYVCPKPLHNAADNYRVSVDLYDVHEIPADEAASDPWIWTVLAWGSRRDLNLIRRLGDFPSLQHYQEQGIAITRQGVIRGDRLRPNPSIVGRRLLSEMSSEGFLQIRMPDLPVNEDPATHSRDSQNLSAFELPQLLVKQGWRKGTSRFQALSVEGRRGEHGALCSKSFFSVHVPQAFKEVVQRACYSLNSSLAVYFLLLTSGRFASYRPEPNVEDLLRVPLFPEESELRDVQSLAELDDQVVGAFKLKASERVLVEDLITYTLPDFKGTFESPGRQQTLRQIRDQAEPELRLYCETFLRILRAGFANSRLGATIYTDAEQGSLPARMVAFHLDTPDDGIRVTDLDSAALTPLRRLGERERRSAANEPISFYRIARVYDVEVRGTKRIPTVYLLKPDQKRYWTRSMAMRDADEVTLDVLQWRPTLETTNAEDFAKA